MTTFRKKCIAMVTVLSFLFTLVPMIAFASDNPTIEAPYRIDDTEKSIKVTYKNVKGNSDILYMATYGGGFKKVATFPSDSGEMTVDLVAAGIDISNTPFLILRIEKEDRSFYAMSNDESWQIVVDHPACPRLKLQDRVLTNSTHLVPVWEGAKPGMQLTTYYNRKLNTHVDMTGIYTLNEEAGTLELPIGATLQAGDVIFTNINDKNGETLAVADCVTVLQAVSFQLEGDGIEVADMDNLAVNDDATIDITPPAGKTLDKLLVNGIDMADKVKDNKLALTLTEANYTVKVSWKEADSTEPAATGILKLEGDGLSADPATGHKDGDTVTVTLTPPKGKVLNELLFNDKNIADQVKDNKVSIKLGAKNTVKVTWKDAAESEKNPVEQKEAITVLTIGSNTMVRTVDGVSTVITLDSPPYINPGQDRTMLPLRAVGEILGMKVEWDNKTRTVSVQADGVNALIPVDSSVMIVNGVTKKVDAAAEIKNSRTMMSISNLAVALGLERDKNIFWDAATRTVTLKMPVPAESTTVTIPTK